MLTLCPYIYILLKYKYPNRYKIGHIWVYVLGDDIVIASARLVSNNRYPIPYVSCPWNKIDINVTQQKLFAKLKVNHSKKDKQIKWPLLIDQAKLLYWEEFC